MRDIYWLPPSTTVGALHRGDRFCSLHVFDVGGPVRPYDKPGKQILGAQRSAAWLRKIDDWIDANVPKSVEMVAIVVTAVAAILALFQR